MKDREIIEKAIRKAVDNGWDIPIPDYMPLIKDKNLVEEKTWRGLLNFIEDEMYDHYFFYTHSFAKAFWGKEDIKTGSWTGTYYQCGQEFTEEHPEYTVAWKHHLQQIVLADNPLRYLEKYI